jgi:uncharacterized protein (TIGR02466 family)
MKLIKETYFPTSIYFCEKIEWVDYLINNTDSYIIEAKKNAESSFTDTFGLPYHSVPLTNDDKFNEFKLFICEQAKEILNEQGYDLSNSVLAITGFWVQEFSEKGGGHHNSHVHANSHINGFFFLKCSSKTSYPIFHDPRLYNRMIDLPKKNENELSTASKTVSIKTRPGTFVFFNSYLDHQFVVDKGIEPFRFIHFNIQVLPKDLIHYKK